MTTRGPDATRLTFDEAYLSRGDIAWPGDRAPILWPLPPAPTLPQPFVRDHRGNVIHRLRPCPYR